MSNYASARFSKFRGTDSGFWMQKRKPKPRYVSSVKAGAVLPEVTQSLSATRWRKPKSKYAKVALVSSLIFHFLIAIYVVNHIRQHQMESGAFEEVVIVEMVPPPPVKLKVRPREIPKAVPEVVQTQQKAPSTLTTRLARRAPQQIAEVLVKGPEVVRESVELHRDAPISQILPQVTTAARFEASTETRHTIAPPVMTPTVVAAPGRGIVTNRVRASGGNEGRGLSDVSSYGAGLRGASGFGDGLGDGFDDVGTTPPKIIQIDQTTDKQTNDLFGIGEYVEEGRRENTQEVVYVLDVSSSMTGSKLRLAIQSLKDALGMLYEGDSFNIVTFNKHIRTYAKTLLPVNRDNIHTAHQFLDRLRPHSGTDLWGGLERALELEASTVVLISDGDASRGVTDSHQIATLAAARNTSHARIMTIALGHGHSDDGVRLLKRLADDHDGQLLLIDLR
ncbi:MAG: VWA domain-containing protein [Candidatus Poribacteria bacterium]|nr:VWA domain-containing protein [Candidatus Poribacteria bacterium]